MTPLRYVASHSLCPQYDVPPYASHTTCTHDYSLPFSRYLSMRHPAVRATCASLYYCTQTVCMLPVEWPWCDDCCTQATAIQLIAGVVGFGPAAAHRLVEKGVTTLEGALTMLAHT